jgi:hypothetical protein
MNRDEVEELLEEQLAKFAGQIMRHVNDRVSAFEERIAARVDRIETTVNGHPSQVYAN